MISFYIFQFLPLTLVEALVLRQLGWAKFSRCLFESALMNFAGVLGLMLGIGPDIVSLGPVGLTLFFTYSFLIDSVILSLLGHGATIKTAKTAALVNLAGTALIAIEVLSGVWIYLPGAPR